MNGKRLWLALLLGLVLLLLCAGTALAADDFLKFNMELNSSKFSAPETIMVSITVTNTGDEDMPGPVRLFYPDGDTQVEEFGEPTLKAGASRNWSGPWTVTKEQLEDGWVIFYVRYTVYNDEGTLETHKTALKKRVQYTGAAPELTVKRTIVPEVATQGQSVSVIYEITNAGSAEVTGVTIKENTAVSKETVSVGKIAPGETAKYTFTVKMGKKDLTSEATITYKAGGNTYTKKVESAAIKYGKVDLSASLSADKKGGAPGDTVKLTLKLTNSGKTDITGVTVTDEKLGTVFSGETVPAEKSVTLEKEITITETQDLLFTVTANDGTKEIQTATGTVHLIATDPTQQIILRVEAEADRDRVYMIPGGVVRFTITVYNDSAVAVNNIGIYAVDTKIYTFESIPAGESRKISRDLEISMAGTFQFTAQVKDQLNQTVSFPSNTLPITFAAPTAAPTATPVVIPPQPTAIAYPEVTEAPEWIDTVGNITGIAKWVLAGLAGALGILLLIGGIRRAKNRAHSNKAMDHLEGAVYRDYSVEPRRGRRNEVRSGMDAREAQAPAEAPAESTPQTGVPMAETLQRLYTQKPEMPAADAVTETAEAVPAAAEAVTETVESAEAAAQEAAADAEAEAKKAAQTVRSVGEAAHRRRAKKD